jgi:hypothetical protein
MPILTLLISDQTIPNLLFVKEYGQDADGFVFITTPLMQTKGKTRHLMDAAGLDYGKCREVVLPDENDPVSMENIFQNEFHANIKYLVNLTCGTKMMFLVAHNFFSRIGSNIYYMPIGKDYFVGMGNSMAAKVNYRINVQEYLAAHGILYQATPKGEIKDHKILKLILKEYQQKGFNHLEVAAARKNEFKQYFTGTWFEQLVYHRLKQEYCLDDVFIETGLKINNMAPYNRLENDSELDIVFTHNNELYVIEAKVNIGLNKINKQNLDNILFKLSALNKNFGLRSHAWVVSLADLQQSGENFRSQLHRRMKILNVAGFADRNNILGKERLLEVKAQS